MFEHGKTKKKYYSIWEKINYFKGVLNGKGLKPGQRLPARVKDYAEYRLAVLQGSIRNSYNEPDVIVTNDKFFGNKISKPRGCVVIDEDNKDRILVSPMEKRTTKTIILDNDISRQIGNKKVWVSKSEIYENKYVENLPRLTNNDKTKIKQILRKK